MRVRLGVVDRLRHRAGVDLAERRRLLGDEFDVGLRLLQERLEVLGRRLAVFEIRIDQRPALLLGGNRRRHQHGDLHVGRGAQAEGIFVAVLPGDLVGERLGGEEEHFLLAGKIGDREADVGEESPREHRHAFARHQFLGDAHRFARIGAVVARDHLELLAEHAAFGVDLLDRHLHALLVRVEEGGHRLVAVQLADLDGLLRHRRRGETDGEREKREQTRVHDLTPDWICADSPAAAESLSTAPVRRECAAAMRT